jgi:dTDP-4-dehydrorhamnose 3,5-epimerase
MMRFSETEIPGCYEVHFVAHRDARGTFVKAVHATAFAAQGLRSDFRESFYSVSGENVLRGMHVQLPPADQAKLVYCVAGSATDVSLDVRRGSPTFGRFTVVELSAETGNGMYLPSGIAHGFHVRRAPVVMMYHVTSEHAPSLDAGIRWDSFGAPWQTRSPLLSARDSALPRMEDFQTPFEFVSLTGRRPK